MLVDESVHLISGLALDEPQEKHAIGRRLGWSLGLRPHGIRHRFREKSNADRHWGGRREKASTGENPVPGGEFLRRGARGHFDHQGANPVEGVFEGQEGRNSSRIRLLPRQKHNENPKRDRGP